MTAGEIGMAVGSICLWAPSVPIILVACFFWIGTKLEKRFSGYSSA